MKIPLALLLTLGVAIACHGQVTFVGYMTYNEGSRFVLRDTKSQNDSEWLRVGQTFEGFRIIGYVAASETLTVEKDGQRVDLPLRATDRTSSVESKSEVPRTYTVQNLVVKTSDGSPVPAEAVRRAMKIRAGGTFDVKSLDTDIRALYGTGRFAFVEFQHAMRAPGAFDVLVIVTPKPPQ